MEISTKGREMGVGGPRTSSIVKFRNLILEVTDVPPDVGTTGIHWPTGQATSIQNVQILMSSASGIQHQGMFIENGITDSDLS